MGYYRFVLAIMVVIGHIDPLRGHPFNIISGPAAVNAFFFVSGFLMPMAFEVYYANYGLVAGGLRFYVNRIIRIYPVYWISLAIIILDYGILHVVNLPNADIFRHLPANLLLIYPGQDGHWLNPVAWSLSIEMQWYILLPLVFFLCNRLSRYFSQRANGYRQTWLLILMIVILAVQASMHIYSDVGKVMITDYVPMFGDGYLLYFLTKNNKHVYVEYLGYATFLCGALLLVKSYLDVDRLTLSLLMMAIPLLQRLRRAKSSSMNRFLGDISYPLFVLHGYVVNSVYLKLSQVSPGFGVPLHIFLVCLIMTAFATVFLMFVILPLDKIRLGIKSRPSHQLGV